MYRVALNEDGTIALSGRVDSSNSARMQEELLELCRQGETVLNLAELEYISSAGLRVLLNVRKRFGAVKAINASSDVYDIFEVTGFTDLIEVKKALRTVDVTGCEVLGVGGTGTVYRLSEDTIVKVYRPGFPLERIEGERNHARAAFLAGLPTAIPFDTVRVGEQYGNVYELMNSNTLSHEMVAHPEKRPMLMKKYVELVKQVGNTHVNPADFSTYRQLTLDRVEKCLPLYGQEYTDMLREIMECIPVTDTLVHGDLHPGNIMLQGDELMLIDLTDMTLGPAAIDLQVIYRDMGTPKYGDTIAIIEQSIGMDIETIHKTWDEFAKLYFETSDPEELEQRMKPIKMVYAALSATMLILRPGGVPEQMIQGVIERFIKPVVVPHKDMLKAMFAQL